MSNHHAFEHVSRCYNAANGLYVASRTRRNDRPVYVQVSLIEFEGGSTLQKKNKDFTPFNSCLQESVCNSVKAFALVTVDSVTHLTPKVTVMNHAARVSFGALVSHWE